jgi:predicted kinase
MSTGRLLLITGLPGSGKSTLAQRLSQRYGVLLLSKDGIKEPLLDVLGADDAVHSRRLSDASFAVLFALARQVLSAARDVILEGNFRPGEHERLLTGLPAQRIVQVLCRIDEPTRLARIARRRQVAQRHAGHGDADPAVKNAHAGDAFLELAGERVTFDSREAADARHLERLDRSWHGA